MTAKLEMVGLVKEYGDLRVLDGVDVCVASGELVSLVGASGCGKSTLLAVAAGLVPATSGAVLLDGHPVAGPGPDRGLVFQSYTLYPWRTVRENVAFGLELQKLGKPEIRARVDRYLEVMGLTAFADALPRALSGGMKQRVAIARALATGPEVLLLDEPFGALDSQTRSLMQEFLLDVWRETGTTILFVTHDVEEAVFLSERIYVLSSHPGRVVEEIQVPFERHRTREVLTDPRCHELVAHVRDRLHVWAAQAVVATDEVA
ncbi:MAG: NitT/TauT family transport system ATP-binding protein [Actinomycetota bacterium]|jgi:NitT/TauT family transport system ATP-binding protein